jgi:DNA-binding SARP family transcriptional activator
MLAVTLLGPVAAAVRDRPVRLTGRLGRTALAALALHDGRAVAVDALVDALWGDAPPATAREQVHNQIPRLRRGGLGSGLPGAPHRPPADR